MSAEGVFSRVPSAHRQWIFINSVLITAFVNIVLNTGLAAAGARGHHVAWWTSNPFTTNLLYNSLGTLFVLPLLTMVGVSSAVAKERMAGTLTAIDPPFASRLWSWICVPSAWRRGARLGVVTFATLAPADVAVVLLVGRDGASAPHFVMVQVLLCVLLGAVIAPLSALAAMCERPATA
ncbi:MAG TPA: hypothetical protein VHA79_09355 [Mycobacteriales bacterium]|jgi:hypothetical protein|nr:hypothetical protein [Mycobacteriales bacterium]HVX69883.1 hypothetical protein [Mycobacteriales bacterium]